MATYHEESFSNETLKIYDEHLVIDFWHTNPRCYRYSQTFRNKISFDCFRNFLIKIFTWSSNKKKCHPQLRKFDWKLLRSCSLNRKRSKIKSALQNLKTFFEKFRKLLLTNWNRSLNRQHKNVPRAVVSIIQRSKNFFEMTKVV